ncbi:MAG: serine hydrolase [Rhodospirillaceae bacterium]|nr:serine hydrolase [Rhodospirillaceae bacterium]
MIWRGKTSVLAVVLVVLGVVLAGQWPYLLNIARFYGEGWITVVDKPVFVPDATHVYRPLDRVLGVAQPAPLPRHADLVAMTADRFAEVTAFADRMQSYAVLVWHQGAVVFEHYGEGSSPAVLPDSASMHKTVAALAVGAAIGRGSITGLDEPIGTYIAEWRDDERGQIRIRNVLNMATGLETFAPGGPTSEATRFLAGFDAEGLLLSRKLKSPPGTVYAYRNLNTQLLGLTLERATGKPYAQFLSEALWQPMGGADAHVWRQGQGQTPRTYTALMARPEDWVRVGRLIKDRGQLDGREIVPATYMDAMLTPSALNPNYGFQIWFAQPYQAMRYYNPAQKTLGSPAREPFGAPDMALLDGVGGQRVYISRADDLVIVRLGVARPDWDDSELPNLVAKALEIEKTN